MNDMNECTIRFIRTISKCHIRELKLRVDYCIKKILEALQLSDKWIRLRNKTTSSFTIWLRIRILLVYIELIINSWAYPERTKKEKLFMVRHLYHKVNNFTSNFSKEDLKCRHRNVLLNFDTNKRHKYTLQK